MPGAVAHVLSTTGKVLADSPASVSWSHERGARSTAPPTTASSVTSRVELLREAFTENPEREIALSSN
jgi:hypothetical protein